jgi:hypothetical protein
MSLLFIDGSEHYTAATALQKYTGGGCGAVSALYGRHGKGISGPALLKSLADPQVGHAKWVIGCAVYPNNLIETMFSVVDGLYLGSSGICSVSMVGNGAVRLSCFGTGSVVSEPDILRVGRWHYVEASARAVIVVGDPYTLRYWHDGIVKVDGATVINAPGEFGVNTIMLPGGYSQYGWDGITRGQNGCIFATDDFYVCDGAGSAPFNTFLGNKRIGAIFPNGVGFASEWTPSTPGDNYLMVDEHDAPDDATTFVSASGDGPLDIHAMEDVDTNNTLMAIQMLVSAKRSNDGFAFLTPYIRHAGVNYPGKPRALASTYYYRNRDIYETPPVSGESWDDAKLNALQAGYRRGEF